MNIYNLLSFIEIVKENSISKAAKNLHISQSALSQQLKALEDTVECKLLERSNKGVEMTEEGRIVYRYAEIFKELVSNMKKEIDDIKIPSFKEIKIASSNSVCEYLIPCTLYTYRKVDRGIKFITKCDYTKNVIDYILKYKADVGFITMYVEDVNLVCTRLSENDLVLIYSPKNKEMEKVTTLKEVSNIGFLVGPEESGIRKAIESIFLSNGISTENINISMELGSLEAIKTLVIENYGISIVPYATVKKELYLGTLKTKDLEGIKLKCDICMVYQKNHQYEEHIFKFIKYMKKYGKDTFC
ncbi:LysR family transcriptional regulator [Tissierella praeacuta]|uniref:LysR family transcriptional regulator n=1 Tax=Tissierella praeacuta TaxID=43131 RepID=UPI0010E0F791|nr:LysR family transcriptional regulator [Tissierella praeacuta]MBU5255885.1 LysR family transcriptional regulator [Tissierella praeacuta]TCU77328.1 DNA-binding transcriptional LysR family regulator [Tissierella praeacuta]